MDAHALVQRIRQVFRADKAFNEWYSYQCTIDDVIAAAALRDEVYAQTGRPKIHKSIYNSQTPLERRVAMSRLLVDIVKTAGAIQEFDRIYFDSFAV